MVFLLFDVLIIFLFFFVFFFFALIIIKCASRSRLYRFSPTWAGTPDDDDDDDDVTRLKSRPNPAMIRRHFVMRRLVFARLRHR